MTHLQMVFDTAGKFICLVPEGRRENVLAACRVHDVIEDCRETYNDAKKATNEKITELTYALTNEKEAGSLLRPGWEENVELKDFKKISPPLLSA